MPESQTPRPPIVRIGYIDVENGNPYTYTVGVGGVTHMVETNEYGEMAFIPWVEVWSGERLLARFNQHKLEQIFYHDRQAEARPAVMEQS